MKTIRARYVYLTEALQRSLSRELLGYGRERHRRDSVQFGEMEAYARVAAHFGKPTSADWQGESGDLVGGSALQPDARGRETVRNRARVSYVADHRGFWLTVRKRRGSWGGAATSRARHGPCLFRQPSTTDNPLFGYASRRSEGVRRFCRMESAG